MTPTSSTCDPTSRAYQMDRVQFIQSNHNLIKEHGDLMGFDSGAYDDHLDEHIKQQYGHGVVALTHHSWPSSETSRP